MEDRRQEVQKTPDDLNKLMNSVVFFDLDEMVRVTNKAIEHGNDSTVVLVDGGKCQYDQTSDSKDSLSHAIGLCKSIFSECQSRAQLVKDNARKKINAASFMSSVASSSPRKGGWQDNKDAAGLL